MSTVVENNENKTSTMLSFGKIVYLIGMLLILLSYMLPVFARYLDRERVWVSYNLFNGEITTIGFFIMIAWIASVIIFYFQMFGKTVPEKFEFAKTDIVQVAFTSVLFSYFIILFGVVSSLGQINISLGLYVGTFGSVLMLLGSFFIYRKISDVAEVMTMMHLDPAAVTDPNKKIVKNETKVEANQKKEKKDSDENMKEDEKKEDVSINDYEE